jgi:hypothetical protein
VARKRNSLAINRAATVPRPELKKKYSDVTWEGGSWRTADGRPCAASDPERNYMVTRLGSEVPRLFIEEMERLERFLKENPNWAVMQKRAEALARSTSLYSWPLSRESQASTKTRRSHR